MSTSKQALQRIGTGLTGVLGTTGVGSGPGAREREGLRLPGVEVTDSFAARDLDAYAEGTIRRPPAPLPTPAMTSAEAYDHYDTLPTPSDCTP